MTIITHIHWGKAKIKMYSWRP